MLRIQSHYCTKAVRVWSSRFAKTANLKELFTASTFKICSSQKKRVNITAGWFCGMVCTKVMLNHWRGVTNLYDRLTKSWALIFYKNHAVCTWKTFDQLMIYTGIRTLFNYMPVLCCFISFPSVSVFHCSINRLELFPQKFKK